MTHEEQRTPPTEKTALPVHAAIEILPEQLQRIHRQILIQPTVNEETIDNINTKEHDSSPTVTTSMW